MKRSLNGKSIAERQNGAEEGKEEDLLDNSEYTNKKARTRGRRMNLIPSISKKSLDFTNNGKKNGMYGDMITLPLCSAFFLVLGWEIYQMEPNDPKRSTAYFVWASVGLPIIPLALASFRNNLWASRLGLVTSLFLNYCFEIAEWPYEGECTVTTSFPNGIVLTMAQISLSFEEKVLRLALFFVVGSYISIKSPYSVYEEDIPILGGTILAAIFGLYVYHFNISKHIATLQGARLIMVAYFFYNSIMNFLSHRSSSRSGTEILSFWREVGLACIGVVSTGFFQDELIENEKLEIKVQKRTQKLNIVNMALQASETAIAITDTWGTILWLNAAFERLSGKDKEELLGLLLKDIIFKLDTSRKENKYLLMESYEDLSKPTEEELKIGESIFQLEATPFPSESYNKNKPITNDRFLMVFKNITDGRAREVAEKKAHHEAIMAKAMGESMMTLTHELRTPLQGIMGMTTLLQQQVSDSNKDALESVKLIMASSTLLLNLINNLLDVRKTTAKMMEEFPLSSIAASGPIKDAVGFCLPLASISNVNIVTDLGVSQNAMVMSNALRLQQVLINLISNAIKYTKRGSDICIKIRAVMLSDVRNTVDIALASSQNDGGRGYDNESSMLVFSISDCGPGIAPEQAGRLFCQYARLDTSPARTLGSNVGQPPGTGLGLHLCQLFVERMNGQIWATNNQTEVGGSSFSFYLPLVSDASYGIIEGPRIFKSNNISNHCSNIPNNYPDSRDNQSIFKKNDERLVLNRRVLMVDDMLINRQVFNRMLRKIGIENPVTVESGKKALEELARNHYDLVITDLQMPSMCGTELSAAIQNSANKSALPIVVGLTADTSADVVEQCSESGMSDVLYKPITLCEMRDFFEITLPNLEPGTWYNGNNTHDMGMNVMNMQISKKTAAKKNENLLLEVFPEKIAGALREGQRIKPEHHDIVTIYFSDIVGFTNISSTLTPIKVSSMLDRLYLRFDELSRKHDVFKIETIGDAYMAVTNLVKKQDDHVKRIANFSKDAIDAALTTLIDEDRPELGSVKIRVGFHSGPVVSNVVGSRNPKFTIIGDTVNAAARMESNSIPLQIQCSEDSALILREKHPDIPCVLRGEIQVKGKGKMTTYWVHQKQ